MYLVTGATGIVGSHLVIELLKRGDDVRILTRPDSSLQAIDQLLRFHQISNANIVRVNGDLSEPSVVHEAIKGCSRVFHCAAMVSFDAKDQDQMMRTNVGGTASVVNACLQEKASLTYISSTAAIGDELIDEEYSEESKWTSDRGRSAYSISKRYAELEVTRGVQEGLDAIIVNPGVIIGPGKWGESSTTLFLSAMKGMRFYPTGANGFVDARDVAQIALGLEEVHSTGKHLLIGENATFKKLFHTIAASFGSTLPQVAVPSGLMQMVGRGINLLELIRMNPFSITSENLKSAYRRSVYNTNKIKELGFNLRGIEDAVSYTKAVFNQR